MSRKWASIGVIGTVGLIGALVAFGYLDYLNPDKVDFQLIEGEVHEETNFALVCVLFFVSGFGIALMLSAFKEALSSFRFWRIKQSELRAEEAEELYTKGRGLTVHGNSRKARKVLRRAQRMAPDRVGIALELARAEISERKFELAERRLKTLMEDDPKNPEVLSLHLELYRRQDKYEGQIATLLRWKEVDPDRVDTLVDLRDLYTSVNNFSEAARVQDRILSLTQGRAERAAARSRLIELHMAHAASLTGDRAIGVYNKVLSISDYAPAYAEIGRIQWKKGNTAKAELSWTKGFQHTSQAGLLLLLEKERVSEGRADEMLKLYKKLGRKQSAPVLLRGRLLVSLGRFQEALELMQRAEPAIAGSPMGRRIEGEALFRLEQFQRAASAYRASVGSAGGAPLVGFSCEACGVPALQWQARCPACDAADGLTLDVGGPSGAPLPAIPS